MIPKIIHYLWLSDEKPQDVIDCISSWEEHLEGYKIIEWNKTNFPYDDYLWTKEAFSVQKWAFVTDFFRLWVLKNHGGIYLDADIMVQNTFDAFLKYKMFIGTELSLQLGPHVIGAEKGHPFINQCFSYYQDRHFIINGRNEENVLIPHIMTRILQEKYNYNDKLILTNDTPLIMDSIAIFNDTFFTVNTYNGSNICYHNCFGAWREDGSKKPSLYDFTEYYFINSFFTRKISQRKGISKYLLLLAPVFLLNFYYNWKMKIKNNRS